jgi:peroxiredoxin (alkyl hydroperoxide reductase subunit C)
MRRAVRLMVPVLWMALGVGLAWGQVESEQFKGKIFQTGQLKPIDSQVRVRVGDRAPDFTLPSIKGEPVSLGQYLGKRNVVLSFVPAAFTPVCSQQWPGYNMIRDIFDGFDATVIGITTDHLPSLHAWIEQMGGVSFPVLSDFWPHGKVASEYGILRGDGTSERAVFVVDKTGVIRYIDVHDINERPPLDTLLQHLEKLSKKKSKK